MDSNCSRGSAEIGAGGLSTLTLITANTRKRTVIIKFKLKKRDLRKHKYVPLNNITQLSTNTANSNCFSITTCKKMLNYV